VRADLSAAFRSFGAVALSGVVLMQKNS
jgi:hypothetical protein